jgi:hypothetical protein
MEAPGDPKLRRFLHLSQATLVYHKARLAKSIKDFMGADVLALVVKQPEWKNNLRAMRKKHTVKAFTS